jgi:hypothetical protein
MIEPVTLKGRSVVLRPLSRDDVPAMRALAGGPRGTFEWAFVPTPDRYSSSLCSCSFARKRSPSVPKPFPGGIFLFICRWYSR